MLTIKCKCGKELDKWSKAYCNDCKKIYTKSNFYKVSFQEMEHLMNQTNCGLCEVKLKDGKHKHVDHCHETGKIRGVLCSKCNNGLGFFNDNPDMLRKAIQYLDEDN